MQFRRGVGVAGFEGGGRVSGVRLAGGEIVPAELVIVGVGAAPATRAASSVIISSGSSRGLRAMSVMRCAALVSFSISDPGSAASRASRAAAQAASRSSLAQRSSNSS